MNRIRTNRMRGISHRAAAAMAVGAGLIFAGAASAGNPLINLPGNPTNGSSISATQYNAVEFSLSIGAFDVAIDASLTYSSTSGTGGSATAYLTTAIGPGTTMDDVVATTSFDFMEVGNVSGDLGWVSLFSGLSLDAGTYYLLFGAPFSPGTALGFISLSNQATYDTVPEATVGQMLFASSSGIDPDFAPASTWSASGLGNRFFRINGQLVPGPSAIALLGVAGLVGSRRRRRH